MAIRLTLTLTIGLLMTGCATKRYGRMQALSTIEKDSLTCREIDIEIGKTQEFLDGVNGTKFDGRDVLAVLGDFGIGNAMEKGDAVTSGKKRLEQLQALKEDKGCP